jgi:hypothetical protein
MAEQGGFIFILLHLFWQKNFLQYVTLSIVTLLVLFCQMEAHGLPRILHYCNSGSGEPL